MSVHGVPQHFLTSFTRAESKLRMSWIFSNGAHIPAAVASHEAPHVDEQRSAMCVIGSPRLTRVFFLQALVGPQHL
jgi:hypothetical protein